MQRDRDAQRGCTEHAASALNPGLGQARGYGSRFLLHQAGTTHMLRAASGRPSKGFAGLGLRICLNEALEVAFARLPQVT